MTKTASPLTIILTCLLFFQLSYSQDWIHYNVQSTSGISASAVHSSLRLDNGSMWFATNQGLINYKVELGHWNTYDVSDGIGSNAVYEVELDQNGVIWAATANGVTAITETIIQNYTTTHGLASNMVKDIFVDDNNVKWFATYGGGLSRFDDTNWQNFDESDGLISDLCYSVFEDSDQAVWVGTNDGVSKYQNGLWSSFTISDGLVNNTVTGITQAVDGTMWFSTIEGISSFDGSTWTNYTITNGLQSDFVYAIEVYNNQIYCGTENGMGVYDGNSWSWLTIQGALSGNEIYDLKTQGQELWISYAEGKVDLFDGFTYQKIGNNLGMINNYCSDIAQDKEGNIWVAHGNPGISMYDGEIWHQFTHQNTGISASRTVDVDTSGNVWFAGSGVHLFDGHDWHHFHQANGLYATGSHNIFCDSRGNVWVAHYYGISKYDGNGWSTYNYQDGLLFNHSSSRFFMEDIGGGIWFCNGRELYTYSEYNDYWYEEFVTSSWIQNLYSPTGHDILVAENNNTLRIPVFPGFNSDLVNWPEDLESMSRAPNGCIWMIDEDGDVYTFDGSEVQYDSQIPGGYRKIYVDHSNSVWLTDTYGLYMKPNDCSFQGFNELHGLDEILISNPFTNPTNDFLRIELSLPQKYLIHLQLFNVHGQLIESYEQQGLFGNQWIEMDVSTYPAGMYVYQISFDSKPEYTGKLLISKPK